MRESIRQQLATFSADAKAQGAAGSVNSLVVIGASLFIGIFVLSQIGESMPQDGSGNVDLPLFNDAFDQAQNVLASAFELGAILPIVVVAAGLLFYVRRFNGTGGRR
jgi:hypothetical protein